MEKGYKMPKMEVEILHPTTRKLTKFTAEFEIDRFGSRADQWQAENIRLTDSNGMKVSEDDHLHDDLVELAAEAIEEEYDPGEDEDE